ncbi:MAG: hypothetical protein ACRD1R_06310 [Acidobacteriota bacterium]
MFDYWVTLSYKRVFFWAILLIFLGVSAYVFYYRDFLQQSIEESLQKERLPRTTRPAHFVNIQGDVTVKKVGAMDWVPASSVQGLQPGDMVQTRDNSSAEVVFFDGSVSTLRPDSLTSIVESSQNQEQVSSIGVEVTSGAINLETGQRNNPRDEAKLMTPDAAAHLQEYSEGEAEYDQKERESNFYILSGGAQVTTREEEPSSYTLKEREGLALSRGDQISAESFVLPPSPRLLSPQHAATFSIPQGRNVTLSWEQVEGVAIYQITLVFTGRPDFVKTTDSTEYKLPPLETGVYSWKVESLGPGGQVSRTNEFFKFGVVESATPSRRDLSIRLDVRQVTKLGDIYKIVGKADPGVTVTIDGENAHVEGDGSFEHFARPDRGTRQVNIVARDLSGITRQQTIELPN